MRVKRMFGDTLKLRFARDIGAAIETTKMNYCQAVNSALRKTLENHSKWAHKRVHFWRGREIRRRFPVH